jgi:P27 family predicted phage terminase small subunit
MAGRKKQPLSVIQGKGRSNHITKEEMKEREKQEQAMRGHTDKIVPPSYLTKKQKEEFEEIAQELIRLNIFSNLDVDGLARYIDTRDEYIKVAKIIRSMKPGRKHQEPNGETWTFANDDYAKMSRVKNQLARECRSAASELGLSITSRLKLIIPTTDKKNTTQSEFEQKFGDI